MLRSFIILMLIVLVQPVAARMYQWVDPASGRTQLSGTPPAWYRSGQDAPRVFVFENGQLVDDTGVAMEEGRRQQLRREALIKAEESVEAARHKAEQSAQLRSRLDDDIGIPLLPELPDTVPPPVDTLEREVPAETGREVELTDEQMAELRRLVSEWESRNQSRAWELLGNTPEGESSARETPQQFLEQNPQQQR